MALLTLIRAKHEPGYRRDRIDRGKKRDKSVIRFLLHIQLALPCKNIQSGRKNEPEEEEGDKDEHVRLKWDMGETTSTLDGIKTNDHGHDRLLYEAGSKR